MKRLCKICGKSGKGHKHKKQFCKKCDKETIHEIAFWGDPTGWGCSEHEEHEDITHCSKCGKKLSKETIKIAEVLGVSSVMCKKC